MLVGFVSDEWYLALADVSVVFESPVGRFAGRSDADGGVYVSAPPGEYDVTLAK